VKTAAKTLQRPRVALLIESSRAYGRGVMSGVAKYMREHEDWSISLQEQRLCDDITTSLRDWKADGILTRIEHRAVTRFIKRVGLPAVSLRTELELKIPCVLTDNTAVSRMAFEHLMERGFRHFAFCGFNGADYSDERRAGFAHCVRQAGLRCHVFDQPGPKHRRNTAAFEEVGAHDGERVAAWLRGLPKPIGLMACNDMRGQQVLSACQAAGVAVPDAVAVIGVDNEEVVCDLCDPPLSSVVPNTRRIGYEAAALLSLGMAGRKLRARRILIGPLGVATRRSTEILAIEDRQVAAAARFIREHATEDINVNDVLQAVPMSRRTLERRYFKVMGHSPKHDILRFRLNRAKQLLAETDFPVATVAEKIGLQHPEYLNRIFKKKTGLTPAQYRARSRAGEVGDALPVEADGLKFNS
jgi:LacI family transcriptional regulator